MKQIIYTFILLFYVSMTWAQEPVLYGVNHNSEQVTTTNGMGDWSACEVVGFVCPFVPFPNENFARREWYYNNVLVGTNYTANQSTFFYPIKNEGQANTVYCKYITTNFSGVTVVRNTNTITVNGNSVGVAVNVQGQATYGCTTPITLNIREYSEEVIGVKIEAPRVPYTVSWQLPAGWSIQSGTAGNKTIVVIPDQYTGGNITATVTLDCGYVATATTSISRPMPAAPEFINFQTTVCTAGSIRYTVNPVCGASSYTFSMQNSLVTFTNGLSTITTTDPYCDIAYNGTSKLNNQISVQANFDNASTGITTRPMQFGRPTISLNPYTWDCNNYYVHVTVRNPTFYDYIEWYAVEDGSYAGSGSSISLPRNGFFYNVQAANACGSSTTRIRVAGGICPTSFSISPNPVSSTLRVVMPAASVTTGRSAASEISFKLYNMNSTALVKSWKVKSGEKEYNFNVVGLPRGQYIIHMEGGNSKGSQRIVIE